MELNLCLSCGKPKAKLECEICHCALCKNCAEFLDQESFSFLPAIPSQLKHSVYCLSCYNENVKEHLDNYNSNMEKAKEIMIFTKAQAKETRFIKRIEDKIEIKDLSDSDEVMMWLAFRAVLMNLNAVIDVDIFSEKVRTGSYQTQKWSGSGIPAYVDDKKLIKDRSFWSTPN